MGSSWKCSCHASLNIEATCPHSMDKTNIDGEFSAVGTFDGRPIYEKSMADSNGLWWYIRFDTPTDRWVFETINVRVVEGITIEDLPVQALDLNIEGQ